MKPCHNYLTKEILDCLPQLYATEDTPIISKVAQVKYFTPDAGWYWYGIEYSPETKTFFGLVVGIEMEFGYFTLDQIEGVRGPCNLKIERDLHFDPKPLDQIQDIELPAWCKE